MINEGWTSSIQKRLRKRRNLHRKVCTLRPQSAGYDHCCSFATGLLCAVRPSRSRTTRCHSLYPRYPAGVYAGWQRATPGRVTARSMQRDTCLQLPFFDTQLTPLRRVHLLSPMRPPAHASAAFLRHMCCLFGRSIFKFQFVDLEKVKLEYF